jgi:hypothetical protein
MNEPQLNDQDEQLYEAPEPILAKIFRISAELLILIILAGACYFAIKVGYNYYLHGTFFSPTNQNVVTNAQTVRNSKLVAKGVTSQVQATQASNKLLASQIVTQSKAKIKLKAVKNDDVIIVDNTPSETTVKNQPSSTHENDLALNLSQLASKLDLYAKLNNKQINNFNVSLAKFQEKFNHHVVLSAKAQNAKLLLNKYEVVNSKSGGYQWYIYPLQGVKNIFVILGYHTNIHQIASVKLVLDQAAPLPAPELSAKMELFQELSFIIARSSQRAASAELYRHKIGDLFKGLNSTSPTVIPLGNYRASLQQWKSEQVLVFSIDP